MLVFFLVALEPLTTCPDCGAQFKNQGDVLFHRSNVHLGGQFRQGPWVCMECGRVCLEIADFVSHLKQKHIHIQGVQQTVAVFSSAIRHNK